MNQSNMHTIKNRLDKLSMPNVLKALFWLTTGFIVAILLALEGVRTFKTIWGGATAYARVVETFEDLVEESDGRGGDWITVATYEFAVGRSRYQGGVVGQLGSWSVGDSIPISYYPLNPTLNRAIGDRHVLGNYFIYCVLGGMFAYYAIALNFPTVRQAFRSDSKRDEETNAISLSQLNHDMYEEEAIEITAVFGNIYADCNDEQLLFKPQSRLPRDAGTIDHALKLSYKTGYPFEDQLERSYEHCYPQLSFFVPDDHYIRAAAYFKRLAVEIEESDHHPAKLDYGWATAALNTVPFVFMHNDFFRGEFLADTPTDHDKAWVQELALDCWEDFCARVGEWNRFTELVKTGDSDMESLEVALARM